MYAGEWCVFVTDAHLWRFFFFFKCFYNPSADKSARTHEAQMTWSGRWHQSQKAGSESRSDGGWVQDVFFPRQPGGLASSDATPSGSLTSYLHSVILSVVSHLLIVFLWFFLYQIAPWERPVNRLSRYNRFSKNTRLLHVIVIHTTWGTSYVHIKGLADFWKMGNMAAPQKWRQKK